jgi:hypothetical protein
MKSEEPIIHSPCNSRIGSIVNNVRAREFTVERFFKRLVSAWSVGALRSNELGRSLYLLENWIEFWENKFKLPHFRMQKKQTFPCFLKTRFDLKLNTSCDLSHWKAEPPRFMLIPISQHEYLQATPSSTSPASSSLAQTPTFAGTSNWMP